MKLRLRTIASVTLAGCISLPVSAHTLKPGLWEIENKMQSDDGKMEKARARMQEKMASMPPEQRKKMEEMMGQRGISLSAGNGGAMVAKICMTAEMIARSELPVQQQGECKSNITKMGGDTRKINFTCAKPPSSGEGQYTLSSDKAYTMHMNVTSSASGTAHTMTMDATGRWLADDCGAVLPITMPPVH